MTKTLIFGKSQIYLLLLIGGLLQGPLARNAHASQEIPVSGRKNGFNLGERAPEDTARLGLVPIEVFEEASSSAAEANKEAAKNLNFVSSSFTQQSKFLSSQISVLNHPLLREQNTQQKRRQQQQEQPQTPFQFELAPDFYTGKCDPCIPRTDYRVRAILHGTRQDVYWQQVELALNQASRDTGIQIEVTLYNNPQDNNMDRYSDMDMIPELMARDILDAVGKTNANNNNNGGPPDALIVTLPTLEVQQAARAALEAGVPVFGFHTGYQVAQELGLVGFVAQDEVVAGQILGEEVIRVFTALHGASNLEQPDKNNTRNNTTAQTRQSMRVAYINHDSNNPTLEARHTGIQSVLMGEDQNHTEWTVDQIYVQVDNLFEKVQTLDDKVFRDCPYDVVVLGGKEDVDVVISASQDNQCDDKVLIATFGQSAAIHEAIINGQLSFAAAPQDYLQSMFVGVMAGLFVTTGKRLSLPYDSRVYLSGPLIINQGNVPTDSIQTCLEQAFPVCDARGNPYHDEVITTTTTGNTNVCNGGCLERSDIRIGGVLHGVTTDAFWDPVFAAAEQAAADLGIILELERLGPQETTELVHSKMAARIRTLCESGVDGIFVTIPDEAVVEPIRLCQQLNIPVISINAGADVSERLGLLHHIGQKEYSAGYGAGQRLVQEGMVEGYCLNHAWGNIVLDDRCSGFSDAIAEYDNVIYRGMFTVADDNVAQYGQAVEEAVAKNSKGADNDWTGIAILCGGASQLPGALGVQEKHKKVLVGSFDLSDGMFEPFADGRLKFGIDQQPFLQGSMPVYLLTYAAYTQQSLRNTVVETGPKFVDSQPSQGENICVGNMFAICSILPDEDMQLISPAILGIGYGMVGLTIGTAIVCMAWTVYYQKKSQLVRVSQPLFLLILCCGCIVSCLSIIFMGVQTEYRYIKDVVTTGTLTSAENPDIPIVDASCMLTPWLHAVGSVMVFSALFAKIWKVKMIFKAGESFRRRTVGVRDILPYVSGMFGIVLSLLIAWQVSSPFQWEREVTQEDADGFALESVGECTSDKGWWFWLALMCFQIGCLLYALVLCFQCKEIPDDFSESSYVSLSVICMFQVMVLAMPISAMTKDDTDVFYFVRACAVFLQNYTVLCLLFVPKMWRLYTGDDELPLMQTARSQRRSAMQAQSIRSAQWNSPSNNLFSSGQFSEPFQTNSDVSLPLKSSLASESAPIGKSVSFQGNCSPLSSAEEDPTETAANPKDSELDSTKRQPEAAAQASSEPAASRMAHDSAVSALTIDTEESTSDTAKNRESKLNDSKYSESDDSPIHESAAKDKSCDISVGISYQGSLGDPPGSSLIGAPYDESVTSHDTPTDGIPAEVKLSSTGRQDTKKGSSLKRALNQNIGTDLLAETDEQIGGTVDAAAPRTSSDNMKNVTWAQLM